MHRTRVGLNISASGYDISWPQCEGGFPEGPDSIAIVGASDGQAMTINPCLTQEARWATGHLELYLNVNSPTVLTAATAIGPGGHCSHKKLYCMALNFGYNDATATLNTALREGASASMWWIDVEAPNPCSASFPTVGWGYWACDPRLNSAVIQGAIDALRGDHKTVGIYTTAVQWGIVTGGYIPSGPAVQVWVAGVSATSESAACSSRAIAGTKTSLLQIVPTGRYDVDWACPATYEPPAIANRARWPGRR